jgi:hypothetical protein
MRSDAQASGPSSAARPCAHRGRPGPNASERRPETSEYRCRKCFESLTLTTIWGYNRGVSGARGRRPGGGGPGRRHSLRKGVQTETFPLRRGAVPASLFAAVSRRRVTRETVSDVIE